MQISDDKKITVIFRVEAGCLGPQGLSHVDKFCSEAVQKFRSDFPPYINWQIVPRHDKTLPELEYSIAGRPLSREHAERYLALFKQDIEDFEMQVFDELPELIDLFFGR